MQSDPAIAGTPAPIADRYTILDRIGAGGAGVVYRARDEVAGRVVAFKQLIRASAGSRAKTMEALFEREYHTLVRLKHPRIIEVYDYGVADDGPYYTMELLEGSDLHQFRRLPYADVCRHLRDVASSLALLHAQRLVHRDVSPRNIRLTEDGTARLLDFGAVASFGANSDVIGTPPFMAPEILRGSALDPRTDLYSLGAVGYFCLTGRPAFATHDVQELPRLWQTPPAPPSALVEDVPPELDRLILSMLSQDPLGRPQTAADVIDQLTVIGHLAPEPHERAEQSYFISSPIVGRGTQIEWVISRIERALGGSGGEVLIEGPAGIGKTRLANELCLAGTLKGTATLKVDAESTPASFGVAIALGRKLLEACPEIARRTAGPHLAVLRELSPELADALERSDTTVEMTDPGEFRLACHSALREWFLAVSRERTLLVSVDNLHAADSDSMAFLAALGRDSRSSRLFVLTTVRTEGGAGTNEALRTLRDRAQRLRLSALDSKSCELLANGLFGGAANAGRVGNLLCARSGGVPRQFIQLAQLMVKKQIAKYEAGSWVLPFEVADDELPARSDEILAVRLSGLSPDAVALAQTLAVHAGAVPLAVALAVSDVPGEGRTHFVLDELIAEQVLVMDGDGYRFRHEAMREAVRSHMNVEVRRRSQLRAAEALLAFDAKGVTERVQAALHLIDAGEEQRGTRILVAAAREFASGAGSHRNGDQLVLALCRMVRAYDEGGRSDHELAALLFPLLPLAYYAANWQFMLEYGERAIEIGIRITGLGRAQELEPELGRAEALKQGLGAAAAGFAAHTVEGIGSDLKAAIAATIGMVPSCMGVYSACFDHEATWRITHAVRPLDLFGEEHLGHTMVLFATADAVILGREGESRPLIEQALARVEAPACAAALGEKRAKALAGGVLFMLGILDCYYLDDRALATASRMENLGVKTWAVTADQVRILYHSLRGETDDAKAYFERAELNAVQGAQSWQAEVFWPALLTNADVLTGDAMAARRRSIQLDRRARELATLKPYAEAARAAYLLIRGDTAEAVTLYEKLLPGFEVRGCVAWETTRGHFAKALNSLGMHDRAKAVAEEVVANMIPADHVHAALFLEAQRQLALAESGLGNHPRAGALLDDLLAKHGGGNNPLLVGLLHQARAEVARRANDAKAAEVHRAEMDVRFRATRNPALIAQCERSRGSTATFSAVRKRERHNVAPNTVSSFNGGTYPGLTAPITSTSQLAELLRSADDPLHSAVEIVARQTKAKGAYLYVLSGNDLQLSRSSTNGEPPPDCVGELARWIEVVRENDPAHRTGDGKDALVVETVTVSGYRLVALQSNAEGAIVGGLILEAEPTVDMVGCTELFDALGRVVEEHGADSLGYVTA